MFENVRKEADVTETSETCAMCGKNLTLVSGFRADRGICVTCGFPYKIDPEDRSLDDYATSVIYAASDVSGRQMKCISNYWEETKNPATLWSYSPFDWEMFEEFSIWAQENGYQDLSWFRS